MWKTWKRDVSIVVITGVITIGGTLYANYSSRESEKPKLGYKRISSISLVSVNKKVKDEVAVSYKQKPIVDLFAFKVGIINTGEVTVQKPTIKFELGKDTEIISVTSTLKPEDRYREINNDANPPNVEKKPFVRHVTIQFLNQCSITNDIGQCVMISNVNNSMGSDLIHIITDLFGKFHRRFLGKFTRQIINGHHSNPTM